MSIAFGKPEIVVDGLPLVNKKKSQGQVARERLLEKKEKKAKKS